MSSSHSGEILGNKQDYKVNLCCHTPEQHVVCTASLLYSNFGVTRRTIWKETKHHRTHMDELVEVPNCNGDKALQVCAAYDKIIAIIKLGKFASLIMLVASYSCKQFKNVLILGNIILAKVQCSS